MNNNTLEQRQIEISELPKELPDFNSAFEPKDSLIKKWIINWIISAVKKNTIKENDLIPKKSDISAYLGVSVGTVQNAIRYVEDEGFLKSKQKLGTMISSASSPFNSLKKSNSKRDKAVIQIKNYILENNFKIDKPVLSSRRMSEILGISQNTTRLAYEFLCKEGILQSKQIRGNEANWILLKKPVERSFSYKEIDVTYSDTLVTLITDELKQYISQNYNIGDKIPPTDELSQILNVSPKTVHDVIKKLNDDGILISRRGRYGTILARNPYVNEIEPLKESSIFSSAENAALYSYQKIQNQIVNLISNKYDIGDKIPSMQALAKMFDVSTNTIRKALLNLEKQNLIKFGRGRFGGTFIIDKPDVSEKQQYQWISINPNYL